MSTCRFNSPFVLASDGSSAVSYEFVVKNWCYLIKIFECLNQGSDRVLSSINYGVTRSIYGSDARRFNHPHCYKDYSSQCLCQQYQSAITATFSRLESRQKSKGIDSHSHLIKRSHLYACIDTAKDLIYSPCAQVRNAASNLLR